MSRASIRAALETRVAALTPALSTAWENHAFTPPVPTTPYQRVFLLFSEPDDREAGAHYQERGYLQVTLFYPLQAGASAAEARAMALAAHFVKGTSISSGGIVVVIDRTPAIGNGRADVDRWAVPVKIPFHADIN